VRDEFVIGRVRGAFGTAGELKVESLSGELAHLLTLRTVRLRASGAEREFVVESARPADKIALMKLSGVDSPEDASKLRNAELVVGRDGAAPRQPGEYYYGDLVGMKVVFGGESVGQIAGIWESGARSFLDVALAEGRKAIVPFDDHFVGDVDMSAGTVCLQDPEVLE
jgi:16S rRNA processing protein RimM